MIDDLFQAGTDAIGLDLVRRPPAEPKPPGPSWYSGLGAAVPRAMGVGGAKSLAFGSELAGAFGSVAGAYPEALGVQPTAQQADEANAARQKLLKQGPTVTNEAGDIFRQRAKELMPDPQSTGKAAQIIAGVGSFATEIGLGTAIAGPLAPLWVGGSTAFDTSDELRLKGVDLATRTKAGAVTGATNLAMTALPMTAATRAGAAAKGVLYGEGFTVGQTAAVQTILKHAGYDKVADQYDPFDPVALSVGLVPGVFGYAFGGARPAPKASIVDAVRTIESGGRKTDAAGNELQGPATKYGTAKGDMQVLDSTALDPGYGIKPAKVVDGKIDPADRSRVGVELIGKLSEKYGDDAKAMAAYNWGAGNLDKLLAQHPDDWQAHLPAETQAYLAKGRALLDSDRAVADAVKADPAVVDAARVAQTAETVDRTRLTPDEDIAGMSAHTDALEVAHDQLAKGDPVSVADIVEPGLSRASARESPALPAVADQVPAVASAVEELRGARDRKVPPRAAPPLPEPVEGSPSAPPPRAAAAAETPEAAAHAAAASAAEHVATLRPDLMVQIEGHEPMKVSDLLAVLKEHATEDKKEGGLVQAAVACLLRNA